MARRAPLKRWLAPAAVLVLLAHGLALEWIARQVQAQTVLAPVAAPMFTRLLEQKVPAAVPVATAPVPGAPRSHRPVARIQAPAGAPEAGQATSGAQTADSGAPQQSTATAEVSVIATAGSTLSSPTVAGTDAAGTAAAGPANPQQPPPPVAAAVPSGPAAIASASPASAPASAFAAAATPAGLDSWPADTRLSYRVGGQYRGELHGDARVQWQRAGSTYQTRVDIDMGLASFVMTSQGEVTLQGLRPRAYEELRNGRRRSALLEEDGITLSDGSKAKRPDGVQDTASQFVELSHRFANGLDVLEVGRSVSIWLARPGGVDLWTYDIAGRETLQSKQLGAIDAFHLKPRPIPEARGNIMAEMWFAPSLQYLPVRIRVTMGEAIYVDLMVEKIEQR